MSSQAPQIRLLLVEDDEDDYILARDLLAEAVAMTFDITWASSATTAREHFALNAHDICLMDYRLGAEIGVNLVREALLAGFNAPIIMLTGQDDEGVEIEAAQAGAVDYLVKSSLGREQLLRAIRYALSRREIQTEKDERTRAEAASRSKSEFLATLSHEIRTPLTSIIGFTELLINQHGDNDSDLADKLAVINRNSTHLLSLLNDTLDLSRIEAGKLEIDRKEQELAPLLQDLAALAQDLAAAKRLEFALVVQQPLPARITTDATRLRQILLNLIGNAIKFTASGTVNLRAACVQTADGHELEFRVEDSGIGIPRNKLLHIFDPFTQLDSGSQTGSGLGLTISRKLAQALGGDITASSTDGKGSVFTLRVDPGEIDLGEPLILQQERGSQRFTLATPQFRGKVLVVDDVQDIRELISGMLASVGVAVELANDGLQALAKLETDSDFQLVLMDLNMPGMNGIETLANIRDKHPGLPVVALTAANLKGDREACLAAGFNAFLPKPVDFNSLIALLDQHGTSGQLEGGNSDTDSTTGILVVEDNPDANKALGMLLELQGYQVTGVHSAAAALAEFIRQPAQIVICDLNLPDQDGLALLQELHQHNPASRLYIISGDQRLQSGSLPAWISGFLVKPVTLQQLQQLL